MQIEEFIIQVEESLEGVRAGSIEPSTAFQELERMGFTRLIDPERFD